MCAEKGFDAVEPDNIAGYENKTGFTLTAADQLRFNRWIADQVHKRGMAVALKNDPKQVQQLVGAFDFAIVEECFQYEECGYFEPFVEAGQGGLRGRVRTADLEVLRAGRSARLRLDPQGVELFAQPWEPCDPRAANRPS